MRRPIEKIKFSPELKERQLKLRKFLRQFPECKWRELQPFGFSIDVSTIPEDEFETFLEIANSVKV